MRINGDMSTELSFGEATFFTIILLFSSDPVFT